MVTIADYVNELDVLMDDSLGDEVATRRERHKQWIKKHCWTCDLGTGDWRRVNGAIITTTRIVNVCCIQSLSREFFSGNGEIATAARPNPRLSWSVGTLLIKPVGSKTALRTCINITLLTMDEFLSTYPNLSGS